MQPSLKNDQAMKKTESIKASLASKQSLNLVFSYTTTKSPSAILLKQRETGFSLVMAIEKLEGVLQINRFTLTACSQLEDSSIALYDAALIEIVLEALRVLFISARQQDAKEMVFILADEDAKNLTSFEGFLETCTTSMTQVGKRTTFTLFSCSKAQNLLLEKAEFIKIQVRHELWKGQRADPHLKNYLQNHQKGDLLPCCQPKAEELIPVVGTILSFPLSKNL